MITILDRYVLRSLVVNYTIALSVMLSLYVTLDLFINMDEFTEHGYPLWTVLGNMVSYYWPNLFVYFGQLSAVITLFACMATITRMRKCNEMTAMLASGVSLHRIAAPVISFGLVTSTFLVIDTEWIIPTVAHKLARDHDDADGKRAYEVLFLRDSDGRLLSAGAFNPTTRDLHQLLILSRDADGSVVSTLEADRATWEPPADPQLSGRWRLYRGRQQIRIEGNEDTLGPQGSTRESYPTYYESDLNPDDIEMRQAKGWIRFLSLSQLGKLEANSAAERVSIVRTRHGRIATPIMSLILLLLGLPFFLNRSPATVLSDTSKCMVACGVCYVVSFFSQTVRTDSYSALPFWIPIFIFATLAMVLIDRIRT